MYSECQFLDVQDPDDNHYTIKLKQQRFTIGRSHENNLVLPNSQKIISQQHCVLECEANFWWVVDESSANGTYVRQRNNNATLIDVRQYGRLQLHNGDAIIIVDKVLEREEAVFWRLTFRDVAYIASI